ncbi:MAG TPA: amino acid ABC transporter permease [Candidatus Borkfalkia excrementavium]|uniref:Amino acid ABC transporter permease n=1 Tax=Candidatus Borkfalkia excrementavium TaxID=2838505 RepID=A0A9D1Z7V7_9FIRM|nr:amino acid ABC transporter permease [Candidatus Borkfalkia excrementavium]
MNLLNGFKITLSIFFLTLLISLPLGLLLSFGSMSKIKALRSVLKTIIWIVRGTPLMLLVIAVYYGPALLFQAPFLPRITAVIAAFVVNYACYFSEIFRGGIESISKGQYEAGQVLGMSRVQIFFRVVLLQVVKRILAPMSNEIITLVKDTALARVIMVAEILKVAYDYAAEGLIWPLFYTAVYYLIFVGILTLLFGFLEKKLNYFRV